MRKNKIALTLLFALAGVSSFAITAPAASAQGFVKASASDLPAAHEFPKARKKIQIVNETPEVTDCRRVPTARPPINILISPLPQVERPGGINVIGASGSPTFITPVVRDLPAVGFNSNIPASGLNASRPLPNGKSTNLLAGRQLPAANRPQRMSQPIKKSQKTQMQQVASYPAFKPTGAEGSQSTRVRTSVTATFKPGFLLNK